MRFKYCPYCGAEAMMKEIGDEGMMPFCERCSTPLFDMFSSCVLCVVVNEFNEVALIKQEYVSDRYVGIAGYIKPGETAEEAAKREISEELGIIPADVWYLKSSWYARKELLMLGFLAKVTKTDFHLSGEVDKARWFTFDEAKQAVRPGSDIYQLICCAGERVKK